MSIGAKLLTNKERAEQTKVQSDEQKNVCTIRRHMHRLKNEQTGKKDRWSVK